MKSKNSEILSNSWNIIRSVLADLLKRIKKILSTLHIFHASRVHTIIDLAFGRPKAQKFFFVGVQLITKRLPSTMFKHA